MEVEGYVYGYYQEVGIPVGCGLWVGEGLRVV